MSSDATRTKPLVSVVLPSYNDREIIEPFYQAIVDTLEAQDEYDYELVYVDDGSADGSQDTLRDLARRDPRVIYVELFRNYGQQRALFAGLTYARGDYVVTIDGDYQYEPEAILQLVRALGQRYDLASGVRRGRRDGFIGVATSKLGNVVIGNILKIPLADFGSVKAFSRRLVDRVLAMRHYYSDVYPTAVSLRPLTVEVPVAHRKRYAGRSHWNLWSRLRLYVDLHIAYKDEQFQSPFKWGIVVAALGVLGGTGLLIYKWIFGHQMSVVEIGFSSLFVLVFGVALSAWALTMSMLTKIYKQNVFHEPFVVSAVHGADHLGDAEHGALTEPTALRRQAVVAPEAVVR